ncbi:hypothetical protein Tco_0897285 [Tanacetum coccineum]
MAPEFWCQTTPTEFWCHGISGAKLHFADVTPLLEFGTKSLAPRLPVLLLKLIIMAQQQHAADVHPDELCPPNKRYDLMDANKNLLHSFHAFYAQFGIFEEDGSCSGSACILCKIVSKLVLTTTVVKKTDGQPPLQLMQMLYCFVNNIHVDYAELLWEGLYYSLHHPTSSIPYPRFTKIIVSHYMTIFPDISRRVRDMYHNLQDDDIMKNIFNSGRHKNKVGMKIPDWMITDEMKQTEHYRMYTEVFGIDVSLTQSQPTESTHETPMSTSAPRSPNPDKEVAESSAPRRSTVIRLCLPERRSTRLTPLALVPTVDKADEMILQDTLQVSLAEHKSREEQEARENVALVAEHLASEEVEKMVDDSSIPRNDESLIPSLGLDLRVIRKVRVNVTDEDEEITDGVYELKRREKGKNVEESRNSPILTPIRSPRIHSNLVSSDTEKLQELTDTPYTTSSSGSPHKRRGNSSSILAQIENAIANVIPSQVDASVQNYMFGHILHVHPAQSQTSSVPEQQYQLYLAMKAYPQLQQKDIAIWLALQMKFERIPYYKCMYGNSCLFRPKSQDDPHDDVHS